MEILVSIKCIGVSRRYPLCPIHKDVKKSWVWELSSKNEYFVRYLIISYTYFRYFIYLLLETFNYHTLYIQIENPYFINRFIRRVPA